MGKLASFAVVLLLVAGLFMVSVFLPPLAPPVNVLSAPSAAASQAPSASGVNGTLASFAALFPNLVSDYLPLIMH